MVFISVSRDESGEGEEEGDVEEEGGVKGHAEEITLRKGAERFLREW